MVLEASGFAVDTNLLLFPTTRRLLHGIALETNREVFILPQVDLELRRHNLIEAELARWKRRRGEPPPSQTTEEALEKAIEQQTLLWYTEDLVAGHTPFRVLSDPNSEMNWRRIADSIPDDVFKTRPSRDRLQGDALVLAQAIHFNVELLSSNNLETIEHDKFNGWLIEKGWNRPLIHTASETIEALAQGDVRLAYTWFMVHSTNRIHERELDNRKEFSRALRILERSGFRGVDGRRPPESDTFRTIVYRIQRLFEQDQQFERRFRQALHAHQSQRQTAVSLELRLNDRVNAAVDQVLAKGLSKNPQEAAAFKWSLDP